MIGQGVQDGMMDRRPFEGELASITLWPEIEKIFGHGYEVSFVVKHPWFYHKPIICFSVDNVVGFFLEAIHGNRL